MYILLVPWLCTCGAHPLDDVSGWRDALSKFEQKQSYADMVAAAPHSIEICDKIINDRSTSKKQLCVLYSVLASSKIDHSRYISCAIRDISDNELRLSAVQFLGAASAVDGLQILLVTLNDQKAEVAFAAASALGKCGDKNTMVALDVWLQSYVVSTTWPSSQPTLKDAVRKAHDAIKARLATQKAAADAKAKPAP